MKNRYRKPFVLVTDVEGYVGVKRVCRLFSLSTYHVFFTRWILFSVIRIIGEVNSKFIALTCFQGFIGF